jgi:hypothetical protein
MLSVTGLLNLDDVIFVAAVDVVLILTFCDPSNETDPVTSPVNVIFLAFCNLAAVLPLPFKEAVTLLACTPLDSV